MGANGRQSDAGIYANCTLNVALEDNTLNIPKPNKLPGFRDALPYVIVADDAFPLKNYIMKPYPNRLYDDVASRVFNYRLSRARRVVENAFGILAHRWRILLTRILLEPSKAEKVVLAACALHNLLRSNTISAAVYSPSNALDHEDPDSHILQEGIWRSDVKSHDSWQSLPHQGTRNHSRDAKQVREQFRKYFNGVGQVPWQISMI